jgi:hypothetical protein
LSRCSPWRLRKLPEGPAWAYELKFDGYRGIGVKAVGQVRLFAHRDHSFDFRNSALAFAIPKRLFSLPTSFFPGGALNSVFSHFLIYKLFVQVLDIGIDIVLPHLNA